MVIICDCAWAESFCWMEQIQTSNVTLVAIIFFFAPSCYLIDEHHRVYFPHGLVWLLPSLCGIIRARLSSIVVYVCMFTWCFLIMCCSVAVWRKVVVKGKRWKRCATVYKNQKKKERQDLAVVQSIVCNSNKTLILEQLQMFEACSSGI
jgi:hypothetical protein